MAHKHGKKYRAAAAQVENRLYSLEEALALVQKLKFANFDETVEVHMKLGVNPRHADQMVRGTVVLPHGLGKTVRVLVITSGERLKEAEAAGADYVGGEEMVDKIQKEGWLEFDAVVASPDMMRYVGRVGKILGPRGLMPNPKAGTVTMEVGRAVRELKAGKVEFRVDRTGAIHGAVGKVSFPLEKLVENAQTFIQAVARARPATVRGRYIRSATVCSTMGPGVPVDVLPLGVS